MNKKLPVFIFSLAIIVSLIPFQSSKAENLASKLKGRILLQVESNGEAWYVNPKDSKRYYMANGTEAYNIMRNLGVGIKNSDLEKIKNNKAFAKKNSGKILLQVESKGEAYYIDVNGDAHYLKDGNAAYNIMRELGLGIKNADLNKIEEDLNSTMIFSKNTNDLYPINLITTRAWSIGIENEPISNNIIFITKSDNLIIVSLHQYDSATGKMTDSILNDYSYIGYMDGKYLTIARYWYEYPNLKVGLNSEWYKIPVVITQKSTPVEYVRDSEFDSDVSFTSNMDIAVILKSKINTNCDVRGIERLSQKIYYTKNSKLFDKASSFICFSDEKKAISSGYKKALDN